MIQFCLSQRHTNLKMLSVLRHTLRTKAKNRLLLHNDLRLAFTNFDPDIKSLCKNLHSLSWALRTKAKNRLLLHNDLRLAFTNFDPDIKSLCKNLHSLSWASATSDPGPAM